MVIESISTIDGTLDEDEICTVDGTTFINADLRLKDSMGRIWYVNEYQVKKLQAETEGEDVVRGACSCVAKVSRKNLNLDDCIGLADDLIRIARADGHFHENEKAWITEMASIMGFSFDNLENWSGIILHE
jgi:tellurite resistance protein